MNPINPVKKCFVTAGVVLLGCSAVLAGLYSRNVADLHGTFDALANTRGMLASRSNDTFEGSPSDYYEYVSQLLEKEYVDPITDERKLSTGAVRGMIVSLDNPDCRFMDPTEFKAYEEAAAGKFQGIGVELGYEVPTKAQLKAALPATVLNLPGIKISQPTTDDIETEINFESAHLPSVVVESVVKGSPADRAGVRVGDALNSVDGLWVMNPYEVNALDVVVQAVQEGKAPRQVLLDVRRDLRKKLKDSLTPAKALDRVTMGTSGTVKVVWTRGKDLIPTTISKETTSVDSVDKEPNGALALHFTTGVASKLRASIGDGAVTLDLRGNISGDPSELRKCIELFGPAGVYGRFVNQKSKTARPLETQSGEKPRALTLMVDKSTSGVAEMFALALQSKGYAKIQGGGMSLDRHLVETVPLSDGSGYTLVTGTYETGAETPQRKS